MVKIEKNDIMITVVVINGVEVELQDIIDSLCDLADNFQFRNDELEQAGFDSDAANRIVKTAKTLEAVWDANRQD